MSVHDEMAEAFLLGVTRPLVVRVVHIESGQVASEHPIPADMTGPEIQHWVQWLEFNSGPAFELEIPDWWQAA